MILFAATTLGVLPVSPLSIRQEARTRFWILDLGLSDIEAQHQPRLIRALADAARVNLSPPREPPRSPRSVVQSPTLTREFTAGNCTNGTLLVRIVDEIVNLFSVALWKLRPSNQQGKECFG